MIHLSFSPTPSIIQGLIHEIGEELNMQQVLASNFPSITYFNQPSKLATEMIINWSPISISAF